MFPDHLFYPKKSAIFLETHLCRRGEAKGRVLESLNQELGGISMEVNHKEYDIIKGLEERVRAYCGIC